jgi:hypothetical protein
MSGSIRVIDLPDLGAVTDASSVVADKGGTGRYSALALKSYCAVATIPEAPFTNIPYGRMNGAWTPVLGDAPSNGIAFARLNATWSAVLPEAPVTGSVYGRGSSAWTPVLPIAGGTISGYLSVTGGITSTNIYANTLNMSSADGYEWTFLVQPGTGDHIQQDRSGWYQRWESSGGARSWNNPSGAMMTLGGGGDLSVSGLAVASQFWVAGTSNTFGLSLGGSGRILSWQTSFYLDFATSGPTAGTLQYVDTGGPLWVMRASDQFCFNPQSTVGGNGAYLNISDRRAKSDITPTTKGLAEVLQLQPVSFARSNPATPAGAPQEIGFIAQDVQPIVPEAVWQAAIPMKDGTGGLGSTEPTLAISEATLTALNVNAIKELNDMITALTVRVKTLEAR